MGTLHTVGPAGLEPREAGEQWRRPMRSTYRWEREEGDGEDGEAGGDGLPDPRLGHLVPVADGGDRDLCGEGGRGQQSAVEAPESRHGHLSRLTHLHPPPSPHEQGQATGQDPSWAALLSGLRTVGTLPGQRTGWSGSPRRALLLGPLAAWGRWKPVCADMQPPAAPASPWGRPPPGRPAAESRTGDTHFPTPQAPHFCALSSREAAAAQPSSRLGVSIPGCGVTMRLGLPHCGRPPATS